MICLRNFFHLREYLMKCNTRKGSYHDNWQTNILIHFTYYFICQSSQFLILFYIFKQHFLILTYQIAKIKGPAQNSNTMKIITFGRQSILGRIKEVTNIWYSLPTQIVSLCYKSCRIGLVDTDIFHWHYFFGSRM